jgi:hypothetical protein
VKVRLLHGDVITFEAITPDQVTVRIEDLDYRCDLALDRDQIARLWEFMVLLMRWQSRLERGAGPPEGFDRDITGWAPRLATPSEAEGA